MAQEAGSAPIENAATGRQRPITGTGSNTGYDSTATLAATTLQAGTTYTYQLPVSGASAIDVTLTMSAHTGTVPTASIYTTYSDGVTQKSSAVNFTTLADATTQTQSISGLRGEKIVMLKIIVPAASTATFAAPTEYSAL